MGRIVAFALLVSLLALVGIIASGGVERSTEQQAQIDRKEAAPRPVPAEDDPVPAAPRTRRVVQREQGRLAATVTMDRLHFGQERVEVKAGESVRWVNSDRVPHVLLADDAVGAGARPTFASDRIAPGDAYRTTFETPGLVRYVCTLHPTSMLAYVVVTRP